MIRAHLVVRGRVQGVYFRVSAAAEASRLGLRGWVRNRADGSVEAVAEGPTAQVRAFADWCRRGPPTAAVTEMELVEDEPAGLPEGFHVRQSA